MPGLDRVVDLTLRTEGSRNEFGEWVPGTSTTRNVWASRRDTTLERNVTEGGSRQDIRRTYRVRWRADIVEAVQQGAGGIGRLGLSDAGLAFTVVNVLEVAGKRYELRRRYLDLEVIA